MRKIYVGSASNYQYLSVTLKPLFAYVLFCLLAINAQAQYGLNDPTFNPNDRGHGFGDGHDPYDPINKSISLPSGKIVVLGSLTGYNAQYISRINRLNSDGSMDTSFHPANFDSPVTDGVLQPDGKLVLTGFFTTYNGITVNHLVRLNTDGSLDTTFHTGTGLNIPGQGTWPGIALQNDGKIIVEDNVIYDYNGTTVPNMCRLNPDGSIDGAYLLNLPVQPFTAKGIALLANGKLLMAAGQLLNTDGTVDSSFNGGGNANNAGAWAIVEQPDHKILIGGSFQTWNGVNTQSILRIDSLGILDTTFQLGASNIVNCYSLALQPNGKVLAAGWLDSVNGRAVYGMTRLNSDGTTDTTFNSGTGVETSVSTQFYVRHINLFSSGQMLLVGEWNTFNGTARKGMVKLNADGSIEPTFNRMGSANGYLYTALTQNDGKLLFGGQFDSYQNHVEYNIVRTDANGKVDTTFNTHKAITSYQGPNYTKVLAIAQQSDGKIVVGGVFNNFGNGGADRIGRFNTDGSVDTSFHAGTGADNEVKALAIDSNGKILIGGNFTLVNGVSLNYLARLNADGSVDNTFQTGTGTNGQVYAIKLQPNGKILVGGYFITYNGITTHGLMRLNTDGTVDTTFDVRNTCYTKTIELLPNGQVLAGGYFSYFDPLTARSFNNLGKFNADGTVDPIFTNSNATNGGVSTIKTFPDGKYFVGGSFSYPHNNVGVFYPNGRSENIFQAGTGANQDVNGSLLQGNNVIICGTFTDYDSLGRNRIARLINFCQMPPSPHGALNVTICQNDNATVAVSAGTGTLGWYSDSLSTNTYLGGGTSYTTGALSQTTTFYVQDSTCDGSFIRTPVTVKVNHAPRVNLSTSLDTVCIGSAETLYISSDSGATFQWVTGATIDSIIVHPAASGYYSITVTSINNCTKADSIYVLTYPGTPVVQIVQVPSGGNAATGGTASASDSYNGNNPADAFDGDTTLTGWANNGDGLPSWLAYDFGAGNSKVIKAYTFYNSALMTGGWGGDSYNPVSWTFEGSNDSVTWTVLDTIADGHLRQGTIGYYISANNTAYRRYRFNFDYTVDGSYVRLNEVQMFAADTQFCRNSKFVAVGENYSAITSYQWKVNGSNVDTSSPYLILPKVHYGDSISCLVKGGVYCAYPDSASGSFIIHGAPNNTCVVNATTIVANAQGAQYQWLKCDSNNRTPIAGAVGDTLTPDSSGTYAVIITEGSCVDTSVCVSFTKPSGIDVLNNDGIKLSIYPNPNSGTFVIKSSLAGEYSLVNALGQKIQAIVLKADVPYPLSNAELGSGIYFLISSDQSRSVNNKIVVIK